MTFSIKFFNEISNYIFQLHLKIIVLIMFFINFFLNIVFKKIIQIILLKSLFLMKLKNLFFHLIPPLYLAIKLNSPEIVKLLLNHPNIDANSYYISNYHIFMIFLKKYFNLVFLSASLMRFLIKYFNKISFYYFNTI